MGKPSISAVLVANAVGLPAVWRDTSLGVFRFTSQWGIFPVSLRKAAELDLSDPQTALGLAIKLDVWEHGQDNHSLWTVSAAECAADGWLEWRETGRLLRRMVERIEAVEATAKVECPACGGRGEVWGEEGGAVVGLVPCLECSVDTAEVEHG